MTSEKVALTCDYCEEIIIGDPPTRKAVAAAKKAGWTHRMFTTGIFAGERRDYCQFCTKWCVAK